MIERLTRNVWNSGTLMTWGSLGIRMGGLALLLPLVLTHLDAQEVLVWQMLATITMLINWSDFGFSPTFSRLIAFARGGGTLTELNASLPEKRRRLILPAPENALTLSAVLGTQRVIYRRMIIFALLIGVIIGTSALWHPIAALIRPDSGWFAWSFTMAAAVLTLINGANVSILVGFDQVALARRAEAMLGAGQIGATSLVVLAGGGLPAIVGCYAFWTIPLYLTNRHNVRMLSANLAPEQQFDRHVFAVVWPAAWRSGIGILMSTGIIQASGLAYAQIASAPSAAAYLLALRIFTAISQISQAPFYSRLPAMAHARGKKHYAEVATLAKRGMAMAHWTFVVGALGAAASMPLVLQWIKSSVQWPPLLFISLLALAFFAERYGAMHMQIYSLTNHIIWHLVNGVTGSTMILLFFIMFAHVGIVAMPISMLISYITIYSLYSSFLSIRVLNVNRFSFERKTTLMPMGVFLTGLFVLIVLQPH